MSLRIYNTLTRAVAEFTPLEEGHVRMYVCGMTVFDYCHVGHARSNVAFDVVQRWLKVSGYEVTHIRNITDIDDKIIKRAVENGESIRALTDRMVDAMHEDFDALGIARPTAEPRATEFVPQMLRMIGILEEKGLAYRTPQGDVNYAVRKFPGYGKLSGKSIDELHAGERVAVLDGKEDPLDFVLWKGAKASEPADVKWESTFGPGRPGWHIECSALAMREIGPSLDVHGGGRDLVFPHHECETAQSESVTHEPFVGHWLHVGLVGLEGTKMSKSLGNLVFVEDLVTHSEPAAVRAALLDHHYRTDWDWTSGDLERAVERLNLWRSATSGNGDGALELVRAALDQDLDTPQALLAMDEAARSGASVSQAALLLGVSL